MTEDEKKTIRLTIAVLENSTCNSLTPEHRKLWDDNRARVIFHLREMLRS